MAGTPADDPVTVFDQGTDAAQYDGFVVVTFASCFSTFGITLKVRTSGRLKEAKQAFGRCAQWNAGGLRYLYKGRIVDNEDTPKMLGMANDDIVQVVAECKFTGSCSMARKDEFASEDIELLSVVDTSNSVIIIVEDFNKFRHRYRVKPTTSLGKVMEDFRGRSGNDLLKFLFDGNRIKDWMTPKSLLKDAGDEDEELLPEQEFDEFMIEAHMEQASG